VARASKDKDRRAVVEQMRREQKRAERRRTLLIIAAAGAVGLLIIGAATWSYLDSTAAQRDLEGRDLATIGVPESEAGCVEATALPTDGAADHRPIGSDLGYEASPPAAGPHYPTWAPMTRKFYTPQDRPEVGLLVHNLEHGYNILWYDASVADDDEEIAAVRAVAEKFPGTDFENKFIAAPWTAEDGDPFPEGARFALTHWSMGGTNGNPEGQHGITQYCDELSGEVVASFVEAYPYTDSPEPGAS
jgi:hypothetical protein